MRRLATAVLVPLAVLAACNRSGPEAETVLPPTTPTTVAESTTTQVTAPRTAEQVVLDDYLAGWDAVLAAVEARDPEHPALVDLYRERALEATQNYIRKLVANNRTARGTVRHEIRSVTIDGTEAVVHDCTDDQYIAYEANGEPAESPVGRAGRDNRLRLEEGRWRTTVIFGLPAEACS